MKDLFFHDSQDDSPIVFSDRVLYTPTSFAKTALLYLQEIGSLQEKKPHTSSRTRLSSYLFSVLIPAPVNWNIRGSGISWGRGTACSLTVSCRTHTVPIQTCGLCRGSIFPVWPCRLFIRNIRSAEDGQYSNRITLPASSHSTSLFVVK